MRTDPDIGKRSLTLAVGKCLWFSEEKNESLSIVLFFTVKNSEYDQEIPQSQTADNPMVPRGRAAQHCIS